MPKNKRLGKHGVVIVMYLVLTVLACFPFDDSSLLRPTTTATTVVVTKSF